MSGLRKSGEFETWRTGWSYLLLVLCGGGCSTDSTDQESRIFFEDFSSYGVGEWIGELGVWKGLAFFAAADDETRGEWVIVNRPKPLEEGEGNCLQVAGRSNGARAGEIIQPFLVADYATRIELDAWVMASGNAGGGLHKSDWMLRLFPGDPRFRKDGEIGMDLGGALEIRFARWTSFCPYDGISLMAFEPDRGPDYRFVHRSLVAGWEDLVQRWFRAVIRVNLEDQTAVFFIYDTSGKEIATQSISLTQTWNPGEWFLLLGAGDGKGWADDIQVRQYRSEGDSIPTR